MGLFKKSRFIKRIINESEYALVITDDSGRVEWINDAFTDLCGYILDELKGKKPGSLLQGPMTSQDTIKKLHRAIKQGRPCSVEILNYHKDGQEYWSSIDLIPVKNKKGKLKGFAALEKDISARKNQEAEKEKLIVDLYSALLQSAEILNQNITTHSSSTSTANDGQLRFSPLEKDSFSLESPSRRD